MYLRIGGGGKYHETILLHAVLPVGRSGESRDLRGCRGHRSRAEAEGKSDERGDLGSPRTENSLGISLRSFICWFESE